MTYSATANRRISNSVQFTEGVQRATNGGRRRGWPRIGQFQTVVKGTVVNNIIEAGGSGEINVYINGVPQGAPYLEVSLDWIHGDDIATRDIAIDARVIAAYFEDEDLWTIISADCVPEPAPAPPGHGNDIDLDDFGAGTTQGTAYGLSFNANRITIATATDNAVRLPATWEQGDDILIRNADGADAVQVFPASGDFINEAAVDTAESLAAGVSVFYRLVESDHWIS